jgi:hypothetical protein
MAKETPTRGDLMIVLFVMGPADGQLRAISDPSQLTQVRIYLPARLDQEPRQEVIEYLVFHKLEALGEFYLAAPKNCTEAQALAALVQGYQTYGDQARQASYREAFHPGDCPSSKRTISAGSTA